MSRPQVVEHVDRRRDDRATDAADGLGHLPELLDF